MARQKHAIPQFTAQCGDHDTVSISKNCRQHFRKIKKISKIKFLGTDTKA